MKKYKSHRTGQICDVICEAKDMSKETLGRTVIIYKKGQEVYVREVAEFLSQYYEI